MKKNQFIKVSAFLFAVTLSSSAMVVQTKAITPKKQLSVNHIVTQGEKEDEARAIVEGLFTDDTHTVVKPEVTQADIDHARALVNDLPAGGVKSYLEYLMIMAQHHFGVQNARKVVYPLYKDEEHTYLREGVTQAELDKAYQAVRMVGDNFPDTNELLMLVILANGQFDAREMVYDLFTDDTHTVIKDDLTQADIDKAQKQVDGLLDKWAIKDDLNKLVALAQQQFDEKNPKLFSQPIIVTPTETITQKKQVTTNNVVVQDAKEDEARAAVDALFTDDTHTAIRPDITQAEIDHARALVNSLPPGNVRVVLNKEVDRALYYFTLEEAKKVVYPLYKDEEHTYLRDSVTRDEINHAYSVVYGLGPNLPAGQLLILVIIAERQFDSREATYALFTDDTHTVIKADLKQADIDKAKELVNSLKDEWAIKGDLNKLITLAQQQLDEKNPQFVLQPAV